MPVEIPQWSIPFRFETLANGHAIIPETEQDSLEEIGDCVEMTLRYEQGERRTLPGFGRPQMLTFTTDHELAVSLIQAAVNEAEPRVEALIERGDYDPDDDGILRILAMYDPTTEAPEP